MPLGSARSVADTGRMLRRAKLWPFSERMPEEEFRRRRDELLRDAPVPVLWLFGKVGSGKSSIVRALTGAAEAEVGTGFRPKTARSRRFDFPAPEEPVIAFIDTRGLGEVAYDPREDLEQLGREAQLVLVTVRAGDHALEGILEPLRALREAAPARPVLLALTALHDFYPGEQHPPYPFAGGRLDGPGVQPELARSLMLHAQRFRGLADRIVPVDFTPAQEGFAQPEYGIEELQAAVLDLLPAAYRQGFAALREARRELRGLAEQRAAPCVLSSSTLAAAAAAVPVPWVELPVVRALQTRMLARLASLHGRALDERTLLEMAGALGGRILFRGILRSALKLVPGIGTAANAALAFAYTYALGRSASWYFGASRDGGLPERSELARVFAHELSLAESLWKRPKARGAEA